MVSTSDIYVWVWLPGETTPVPAGRLRENRPGEFSFDYGRRYRERGNAVSLSPTLPLTGDTFGPTGSMGLPGAIRDASPDAWGRRVVQYQTTGDRGKNADTGDLDERTYLLRSGSDNEALVYHGKRWKFSDVKKMVDRASGRLATLGLPR